MPTNTLATNNLAPLGAPRASGMTTFALRSDLVAANVASQSAVITTPALALFTPILPAITFTADDPGWAGDNLRQYFDPSFFTEAVIGNTAIVTFNVSNVTTSGSLDSMWIGQQLGTDQWAFDGHQKQVTFNGGATSLTLTAGMTITSDPVVINLDTTQGIVIAAHFSGSAVSLPAVAATNCVTWYDLDLDTSYQSDPSGYLAGGGGNLSNQIEGISQISVTFLVVVASAIGIASTEAGIDAPVFVQTNRLATTALTVGAAQFGTPALIRGVNLSATNIASGASQVNAAAFNRGVGLVATALASGSAGIGASAFNQKDVLVASSVAGGAVGLGSPVYNQAGGLTPTSIASALAAVGAPVLHTQNTMTATGIATAAAQINCFAITGEQFVGQGVSPTNYFLSNRNKTVNVTADGSSNLWVSQSTQKEDSKRRFSITFKCSEVYDDPKFGIGTGTAWYANSVMLDVVSGYVESNGSNIQNISMTASPNVTHILDVEVDFVAKLIWFRLDGGLWNNNAIAAPDTGVGGVPYLNAFGQSSVFAYVPDNTDVATLNTGDDAFTYASSSGFAPWFTTNVLAVSYSFTAVSLATSAAGIGAPNLTFNRGLAATSIATAVDAFGVPAFTWSWSLTGTAIGTGRPIGSVSFFGLVAGNFAQPITTAAASLGSPPFNQTDVLTATSVASGAATIGQPSTAPPPINIASGAASLGQPVFVQSYVLTAQTLTTAAVLSSPAINPSGIAGVSIATFHPLGGLVTQGLGAFIWTANSLASGSAAFGTPALTISTFTMSASSLATGADAIGTPATGGPLVASSLATVSARLGPATIAPPLVASSLATTASILVPATISGGTNILSVTSEFAPTDFDPTDFATWSGITVQGHAFGQPVMQVTVALAPNGLATISPNIGNAAVNQLDVLVATSIATRAAAFGVPAESLTNNIVATPLVTGPAQIGASNINQTDRLSAATVASQAARFIAPVVGSGIYLPPVDVSSAAASLGLSPLATVYTFTSGSIASVAISITQPVLNQKDAFTTTNFASTGAGIDRPNLTYNVSVSASVIASTVAGFDRPQLNQVDLLAANGLATRAATVGSTNVVQSWALLAQSIVVGATTIGSPGLISLNALTLNTRRSSIGVADFVQVITNYDIVASDLATTDATIGQPGYAVNLPPPFDCTTGSVTIDEPDFAPIYVFHSPSIQSQPIDFTVANLRQRSALVCEMRAARWLIYGNRLYLPGDVLMLPRVRLEELERLGFVTRGFIDEEDTEAA